MIEGLAPFIDLMINQGLAMSFLGIAVYVLYQRYNNADAEKNELAKQIVELILKYQSKDEELKEILREQKDLLAEIKGKLR